MNSWRWRITKRTPNKPSGRWETKHRTRQFNRFRNCSRRWIISTHKMQSWVNCSFGLNSGKGLRERSENRNDILWISWWTAAPFPNDVIIIHYKCNLFFQKNTSLSESIAYFFRFLTRSIILWEVQGIYPALFTIYSSSSSILCWIALSLYSSFLFFFSLLSTR